MSIFFSKLMDNDNFSDIYMKRNKKDRITDHLASLQLTFSEFVLCPQKGPCLMGSSACVIQVLLHNLI